MPRSTASSTDAVVVVETHQCPSEIASNLGIEPAVGFSDVLSGSTSALDAVIPTDSPNVYVLPANSSHTTSDTLGSESLDNALKELDAHFKYIVLTAAPVLDDADAAGFDASADLDKAIAMLINGKTRRVSVCNATETVLIDAALPDEDKRAVIAALQEAGVEVHGGVDRHAAFGADVTPATEADFAEEYLSMDIASAVVDGVDGAIAHIARYSSGHTEAIAAQDADA